MLNYLFRFELKYHFRQVTFWGALLLYFILGFLMSKANFGGQDLHRNAPYVITYIVSLLSLCSIFVSTVFCASVVLRDHQWQMDALVFSSGLKRWQWFLVRLGGLVTSVFLVLAIALPGCMLGWSLANPDQLGVSSLSHYIWPLFVFGLPDIFFCCSLVFAAAVLGRSARSVYATGVLLFILYFTGSILGNSPLMAGSALKTDTSSLLPFLMDPFGIMSFFEETRNWTVVQRNETLFPFDGVFLLNRLIWLLVSMVLLFISYRGFQFMTKGNVKKKKQETEETEAPSEFKPITIALPGKKYHYHVFIAQLKLETASLFRHLPFLFLLLLWIFLFAIDLKEEALEGPYGIRYYAVTGFIVDALRSMHPALFLLVLYASEILHREHSANMQGLVFSTPAPASILWRAKLATLLLLVLLLVTVNILIGIITQLFAGNVSIEWNLYWWLYYFSAWPLFLYAILIVFIQCLIRNKYLSLMLSLVLCGVLVFGNMLGMKSLLMRYAALPDLRYSSMNGFGHYAGAVHWYLLYWTCLALVFGFMAVAWWRRYAGERNFYVSRTGKIIIAMALIGCVTTGVFIYSQSTALNGKPDIHWRTNYELNYAGEQFRQQPMITSLTIHVDLYTKEKKYEVKGKYLLRNETNQPMDTLWLGVSPEVTSIQFNIPNARPLLADAVFKQYKYRLLTPLLPGDTMSMAFNMQVDRNSFLPFNSEHSIVENGSYVELEKYIPWFGYNTAQEIDDPVKRTAMKLPPQEIVLDTDSRYHNVGFDAVISTETPQQVITIGAFQKSWTYGNRSYFHYKSAAPVPLRFAISSGKYAVKRELTGGIQFSLFYQAGQEQNVPVMMQGMKDAIAYGNTHFCQYPFRELLMAEVPHYPGAATAYPGVLFSAERINFMSDYSDTSRFNAIYTVAAHETAHQWWAHLLTPQGVPGRAFLTESLAKFTEIVVAEKRFGREKLHEQLQKDHLLYFNMRNMNSELELPLVASDQSFAYYQKGGLSLYAIQEMIGESRMNGALQRLLQKHGADKTKPVPADLVRELMVEANADEQQFILDRLQKVILYDAALQLRSCNQRKDGQWELVLNIAISKWDHTQEKPIKQSLNEVVSLAVYEDSGGPVRYDRVAASDEQVIVTILLKRKPSVLVLDPQYQLLDENRNDNRIVIP